MIALLRYLFSRHHQLNCPPRKAHTCLRFESGTHRTAEEEDPAMRPWTILGLFIVAGAAIVLGCSQEPRVHIEVDTDKPPATERVADQPTLLRDGDRIVKPSEL